MQRRELVRTGLFGVAAAAAGAAHAEQDAAPAKNVSQRTGMSLL